MPRASYKKSFIKKPSTKILLTQVNKILPANQKASHKDIIWYLVVFLANILGYLMMIQAPFLLFQILGALILGASNSTAGLSVAHEILHRASFQSKKLTRLLGYIFSDLFAGYASSLWIRKHNIFHHDNTNLQIKTRWADSDVPDVITLKKILDGKKSRAPLIPIALYYGFLSSFFVVDLLKVIANKDLFDTNNDLHCSLLEKILTVLLKIARIFLVLVLPITLFGVKLGLLLFFLASFTEAMILFKTFLIAHINPDVDFLDQQSLKNLSWQEAQIVTSANFATSSRWQTRFFGGLNFQIEHHLFPYLHPRFYPTIAPIVESWCKENNIRYTSYQGWWDGVKAVVRFLLAKS